MSLSADTIVEILKLGLSGFAFLMMAFSYLLLRNEQRRERKARPGIIKAIYVFMFLSIGFTVVVALNAAFGLSQQSVVAHLETQVAECRDGLTRLQSISEIGGQSVDDLQAAIDRTAGLCDPLLIGLDNKLAGDR